MPENNQTKAIAFPKKDMQPTPYFNADDFPADAVKNFISSINNSIEQYNNIQDIEKKLAILKEIQNEIRVFNYQYPIKMYENSMGYRSTQEELFTEIKYQYASLGQTAPFGPEEKRLRINQVIANMSPEKANKLLHILDTTKPNKLGTELQTLYGVTDNSEEAEEYRELLKTHEITFLGGNNSKNFQVRHIMDNSEAVLKVDHRFSMSREVEARLRHNIPEIFAPIYTERMAFYTDSKNVIGRTLQVTEFYPDGNLAEQRGWIMNLSDLEKKSATTFLQMASAFLRIEQNGCAFPDAKIANWLIDSTGNLRLADTKSFVFTKEGKVTNPTPNEDYGLVFTRSFIPPECGNFPFEANKVHSYLLGKNLYLYLTGADFVDEDNGVEFDFEYDIFQKQRFGPDYKQLIEGLVQAEPEKRMPVSEAHARLKVIELLANLNSLNDRVLRKNHSLQNYINEKHKEFRSAPPEQIIEIAAELQRIHYEIAIGQLNKLKSGNQKIDEEIIGGYERKISKEFNEATIEEREKIIHNLQKETPLIELKIQYAAVADKLDKLKFGSADKEMSDYLDKQQQRFKIASPDKQKKIIEVMHQTAEKLQADPAVAEIRTIINSFREKAGLFTIGMKSKADRIEREMAKVSLEIRCNFMEYQQKEEVVNVVNQLASKRSLYHNGMIPITDKGELEIKKAATTFNDFKKKFQEQRIKPSEDTEQETPTNKKK